MSITHLPYEVGVNNYYFYFTDGKTEHREVMKIVQSHQ